MPNKADLKQARKELIDQIVKRASTDETFRKKLATDPHSAIEESGLSKAFDAVRQGLSGTAKPQLCGATCGFRSCGPQFTCVDTCKLTEKVIFLQ